MPTDDERREAAWRLRRVADKRDGVMGLIVERHIGLESDERYSAGSVFTSESVKHLADLIDPGESQSSATDSQKPCDRDALLAIADDMEHEANEMNAMGYNYDHQIAYARCIRKALGVEE